MNMDTLFRFNLSFLRLAMYTNDDDSREFLSIDVGAGTAEVCAQYSYKNLAINSFLFYGHS